MQRTVANTEFPTPTSTRNNSTTMTAIDEAIDDLKSQGSDSQNAYKAVAEKYGVVDTTLRRRYLSQTTTRATQHARQRVLTPQQDNELLQWIQEETQGQNPPSHQLVAQKASLLAGRPVSKNWVYGFLHQYHHLILSRRAAPIERVRASADSYMKHKAYFTYILGKVEEYSILLE
jgi:transposase-like protein